MRHRRWIAALLLLIPVLAGTAGCATSGQWAEWRRHSSHFASRSHPMFSVRHQGEHPSAPITSRDADQAPGTGVVG